MEDTENFHYRYKSFNRNDGHKVTFGRVFFGVLGYWIIKFILVVGSVLAIGLYFR